jgi:hypothetical protein
MRDVIAFCWYVPWLREGCQDRLAGSVSTSLLLVANMFRATMCLSSGADDREFIALSWYVPWLREGCQAGRHLVRPLPFY